MPRNIMKYEDLNDTERQVLSHLKSRARRSITHAQNTDTIHAALGNSEATDTPPPRASVTAALDVLAHAGFIEGSDLIGYKVRQ